jgi:HEAT repeat protein
MKTSSFLVFLLAFNCLLIGMLAGCTAKAPQVNVSANSADLKSPDKDKRVNACIELAKAGPAASGAVQDLIPLLKDPDPLLRRLAAYALGQIGPKAAPSIPALRETLNDSDSQVVSDSVNALRFIGDTNANVAVPNVMTPPGSSSE